MQFVVAYWCFMIDHPSAFLSALSTARQWYHTYYYHHTYSLLSFLYLTIPCFKIFLSLVTGRIRVVLYEPPLPHSRIGHFWFLVWYPQSSEFVDLLDGSWRGFKNLLLSKIIGSFGIILLIFCFSHFFPVFLMTVRNYLCYSSSP